jgi:hypothetical protein
MVYHRFISTKGPLYPHITPSETKEKRYTTVHYRYLIDCSYCGHLTEEMNLSAALKEEQRVQSRHNTKDENITVFDVMAKKGTCDTWDLDGKCLHYKR